MKKLLTVNIHALLTLLLSISSSVWGQNFPDGHKQIVLTPEMIVPSGSGTMETLIDEQEIGKKSGMLASKTPWDLKNVPRGDFPLEFVIDLGEERHLSHLMFWDLNGHGEILVESGGPENWTELVKEDGVGFKKWKSHHDLDRKTRYLRLTKQDVGGAFGEMLVYEYTPEQAQQVVVKRQEAEAEKKLISQAKVEAKKRPLVETGTLFGKLPLVDTIDITQTPEGGNFKQHPEDVSKVETILGREVRIIPNEQTTGSYYAYRIANGKYLEAGKAYLLTIEFPEDQARTFTVTNRGSDMIRTVSTGHALGDTIFTYTDTNLESIRYPLSGKYETFQQLFWLNERYLDIKLGRNSDDMVRHESPVRGFWVIISQWAEFQAPESKGAAVAKIRLFEVPDPDKFTVQLRMPPSDLPQRHLFYREEMADGVVNARKPEIRAFDSIELWYEHHFRQMKFLGMNTFSKDLMEFGAPQHWDVQNGSWYHQSKHPNVWGNILPMMAEHGLNVLPYYEYAGSTGPGGLIQKRKELVKPLKNPKGYTHVPWAEAKQIDLTDPKVWEEFKQVLDLTIVQYKDQVDFVGMWLRPRVSQMPVSFADPTIKRFVEETKPSAEVTRKQLQEDELLYEDYIKWWDGKRLDFLTKIRAYLKENGVGDNPVVLFMPYHSEPAPTIPFKSQPRKSLVTDDPELWDKVMASGLNEKYTSVRVIPEIEVTQDHLYRKALVEQVRTWGGWEWQHAARRMEDPTVLKDVEGVMVTYPFNKMYTVSDPETLDMFRAKSGLAMIRHFPLNETTMDKVIGYFVSDVDRPGDIGVMAEALAMANGDPWYLGYTAGHIYSRPFPEAVRRFNANFLALPALPSKRLDEAASDSEVVVRHIDAGKHGSYYAIVNTTMLPKDGVKVQLLKGGKVIEAATGKPVDAEGTKVSLSLAPYELRSLHVQ